MRAACALLLLLVACSDTQTCDTLAADLGDLCIPGTLAPNLAAVVDVRESCGPGCTDTPTCSALFVNGQIVVQTFQDVCPSTTQTPTCLDMGCQQRVFPCTLPALPAGDYTMTVPGSPPRSLHFANGGVASCRLPLPDGGVQ
jgi:hypothetical protein